MSPAWTTVSAISINEPTDGTGNGDIAAGVGQTLVLKAPAGFEFNTAQTPDVSFIGGRDIGAAFVAAMDATSITISLTVTGTATNDSLTIGSATNLQIRPTAGVPLAGAGNIYWPTSGGGSAVIAGLVADTNGSAGTSFGALSETAGLAAKLAFTSQPGSAVAGVIFGNQPVVKTTDQFGTLSSAGLPATLNVILTLTTGTGLLQGVTNLDIGTNAGNSTVTYTNLQIDLAGTNKQLTASAAGLSNGVSSIFTVKATQTISFGALANKTYGDVWFNLSATASSGLPVSFSIFSGPATINSNAVTITGAGLVIVRASQAGDATYSTATNVDQSFTVAPAALTIAANTALKSYGSASQVFTASYTGFVNGDTPASLTGALNFTTTATTISPVGFYPIFVAGQSSSNYTIAYVNSQLTVVPAQWPVSSGGNGHYYEVVLRTNGITWSNAQAVASVRGGYLATITSTNENAFIAGLISGNTDLWVPDGGGGDGPWMGGIVLPGQTSATNWTWVTGELFTYNNWAAGQPNNSGGNQDHIQFYSAAGLTGDTWNDLGGNDAQFAHGYIIEYETQFTKSTQTVAFAALPDKFSTDAPFSLSATASSGLPVSFSVISGPATLISSNVLNVTGAGNVVVRASQVGSTNYFEAPDVDQTFTVQRTQWPIDQGGNGHYYEVVQEPFGQRLPWTNLQAVAQSKGGYLATITSSNENIFVFNLLSQNTNIWIFDSSGIVLGPWLGGNRLPGPNSPTNWIWVTGENFTYQNWAPSQPDNSGGHQDHIQFFSPTNGIAPLWNDLEENAIGLASSYIIEYDGNPNFTNQTIAFGALTNRIYGDAAFVVSATASSGLPVTFSILSGPASITGGTVTITGAGTVTVRAVQPGNANYNPAPNVDESFTVNPAGLAVTANSAARAYGATNPVFGGTLTGVVNGDNITATFSSVAITNSPVGPYSIVPALVDPGSKLGNYVVTATNGTLTVIAASLTVAANNASRVYGATNPVCTGTITGVVNGDNITATFSSIATTNSPVGPYNIVPALVDPSSKLGNYTVSSTNGTLVVTAASLTVAANNAARAYGATNPVFGGTLAGLVNGDNITATFGSIATTNSPVGPYNIVTALVDPNSKLGNYTVSATNGTLTVTAANLTASANNASRAYGATNPVFGGTLTGVVNGDNITATFSSVATTNSPVGPYSIVPALVDPSSKLGNYVVTATNGTLTVTTASLTVVANNASRAYGATNPSFTGTITGVLNGDNITATYSTIADAGSRAGTYPIVPVLVDPNGKLPNYLVHSTNGNLTIAAPPPPAILSIVRNQNSDIVLTWSSLSNLTYRVQYNDTLGTTNWTDATPDMPATGDTATMTNSPGVSPQRFYRVLLLP